MENYDLNEEDYKILKELLMINKDIKNIYNSLYKLEICHNKDSEKYNIILNDLKEKIEKENALYKLISTQIEKLYAYANYLFPNETSDLDEEIKILNNDNANYLIKLRVSKRVNDLINEFVFENFEDEEEPDEFDDNFEDMDCLEEFRKDCLIEKTIKDDIMNTLLIMLNKYINNYLYDEVKEKLVKYKYNISYINKYIENYILSDNFDIKDNLYLRTILISDIERRKKDVTYAIFDDYICNLCFLEIDELIKFLNNNDEKNIIITLIIIRSCMIYIDNRKANNIKRVLELEMLLSNNDSKLINNLVNDITKENNNDKEIPQILSLRP